MTARQLSHHEIWDDSALVTSWNEALEEYKKYHSIAAKGERVEDVLDAAEKAEELAAYNAEASIDETTGLPPWQSNEDNESVNGRESHAEAPKAEVQPSNPEPKQRPIGPSPPPSNMPQTLLNTVQDENLKGLMMSWYYAGYYTGLYEGQQKALAAQQDKGK